MTNKILELEQALEEAMAKLEEAESTKLRALADLQNYQRREAEQRTQWGDLAVGSFLKAVLPSFLELQLGAQHSSDQGVKQVVDKFFGNLSQGGLSKIEPQPGDVLDPNFHEVMMTAEGESGKIVQTLESGWQYKNTVLIPAKVSAAMQS